MQGKTHDVVEASTNTSHKATSDTLDSVAASLVNRLASLDVRCERWVMVLSGSEDQHVPAISASQISAKSTCLCLNMHSRSTKSTNLRGFMKYCLNTPAVWVGPHQAYSANNPVACATQRLKHCHCISLTLFNGKFNAVVDLSTLYLWFLQYSVTSNLRNVSQKSRNT